MCSRCAPAPDCRRPSTLEIGCGDGALLCELRSARASAGACEGVEITQAAVDIARERAEIDAVELYDGAHLPAGDGEYELGILSHVLEHVPDPPALLGEAARACGAVVMEVPLEANLSARRAAKREHAEEVGHLQRLDRAGAREIVARAGLRVAGELEDPLPLSVHVFFATTPFAPARGHGEVGAARGPASSRAGTRPAAVHGSLRVPVPAAGGYDPPPPALTPGDASAAAPAPADIPFTPAAAQSHPPAA